MSSPRIAIALLAGLLLAIVPNVSQAQSLRVYTKVTDVSRSDAPQPLSNSLTLFHGGRVYDYMDDVGELVIFEPIHNRFIILGKNFSATEVSFAEVNHFLETAKTEAVKYIEELASQESSQASRMAASVRFQLSPTFQESFNAGENRLTLSGTELQYSVLCRPVDSPQIVNRYLEYADWAKRLNFVLHRHSSLPQARLKLNETLRNRGLLPGVVELTMHLDPPVKIRAEHRFSEELQSIDRRHINLWERNLQSDQIRWMTFHEYQQNLLVHNGR